MEMDKKIKDIRQARGIVTVHEQSILRLVNGSFESARTEEFQVLDRYQNATEQEEASGKQTKIT